MAKILITEHIDPVGISLLEAAGHELVYMETRQPEELAAKMKDADVVLVRILDIPAAAIEGSESLMLISKHGVGVDNIDLQAAKKKGVAVTITPGANSRAVAEHTMTLMLALAKSLIYTDRQYKEIGFAAKNCPPGMEISGKTLGIIGCGRIGSQVACMAHLGFGMRVLAYDPYVEQVPEGVRLTESLEELLAESDVVTLHCLLNEETNGILGEKELAMMKPSAFLINCGRGPLIDEEALIRALEGGKLAGAGLDVTMKEPCDPDSPLFTLPNVILTPHFAPTTVEAAKAVSRIAAENIIDYLAGKEIAGRIV